MNIEARSAPGKSRSNASLLAHDTPLPELQSNFLALYLKERIDTVDQHRKDGSGHPDFSFISILSEVGGQNDVCKPQTPLHVTSTRQPSTLNI
jgi:hypothetical protein